MHANQRFLTLPTLGALLLTAGLSHAEDPGMKPGLWQHEIQISSESGKMEKMLDQLRQQMESMPAGQRQMMENMMKSQGMDFDFQNQSFKTCLTPGKAAEGNLALMENSDCQETGRSNGGGSTTISFACSGDTQADGTITFDGDTSYSGESNASVEFQGPPEKMTITHQGEWQGSDCGNIKPQ
jgi:hypothetical protein